MATSLALFRRKNQALAGPAANQGNRIMIKLPF